MVYLLISPIHCSRSAPLTASPASVSMIKMAYFIALRLPTV